MHINREELRNKYDIEESKVSEGQMSGDAFSATKPETGSFNDQSGSREKTVKDNPETGSLNDQPGSQEKTVKDNPKTGSLNDLSASQEKTISDSPESDSPDPSGPKKSYGKWILLALVVLVFIGAVIFKIYMDVSYKPLIDPKDVPTEDLNIKINDNMIVVRNPSLEDKPEKIGIIIYPELRVEAGCYLPLMIELSKLGYDCFLPVAFGNQNYLNVEGAEKIIRKFTSIKRWYHAGHVSGCTIAASYAASHPDKVEGLIWLGGFSRKNISGMDVPLLSIYGTEDTVTDPEQREAAKKNDPEGSVYRSINGANCTGFTNASMLLKGDSEALIPPELQRIETAVFMDSFIMNHILPIA